MTYLCRSGGNGGGGISLRTCIRLSPAGLVATLAWLASSDGPTAGALLTRPGVAAAVVFLLRIQHLQALQV